ncbi:LysM peptidoglycan-binding domain-containing protein [Bacillus sp. V3B]|uniref:LysM peptidoglycan-binding domain-containing protein n=1 Tax=Bacillus sp. V3B TaxID=2804915 RepID=UPI002109DA25|nr:LysM peptidoglycan-binding domain-containing protein [Bacillus sp. V3B]MCQ6273521.1 LysM peptidoglycan-binding domain-containing protein [Bacillus sp. V3B]
MNVKLPNGKWTIIGMIILLTLLIVGIYFFVLYPKMGLIDQKEKELKTQQQLLSVLESKRVEPTKNKFASTSIQELVPVKPLTEQLLLDIEKAEVVSGSFVSRMSFADSEVNIVEETNVEDGQAASDNSGEQEPTTISLPEGVKKITVSMNIESPSYFELEDFIGTLERSKRITVVESIDFTGSDEVIEADQEDEPLSFQVTLSAFYMPTLTDLIDQLPKMENPGPAKRKNPFSTFSVYDPSKIERTHIPRKPSAVKDGENSVQDGENSAEGEGNTVQDEKNPQEGEGNAGQDGENMIKDEPYLIHTVKPGDTIFELAFHYYHSIEGMQKIRDANGIFGHLIFIGQKLIIPFEEGEKMGK